MGKGSKSGACKLASHRLFKDRAKNRVDDLQGMFSDLQVARKERRSMEVSLLEEQLHQMLREWKTELSEPSPASSLQGGSLGPFSSDICRLLQLCEEEDDATSALAAPKPDPDGQKIGLSAFTESIPGIPPIRSGYNPATWMLEISTPAAEIRIGKILPIYT